MSLQFVIGRSGTGKTSYCYKQIEQALLEKKDNSLIMIVPEQFNLQTQEALAYRIHPGLLKAEVQSFKNLALSVFGELGGPQEPIVDDLGRLMILRKVIEENQKELTLFKKSGKKAGFMECLNHLITEFEQYRITSEVLDDLYEKSTSSPALQNKIHDIKIIYQGFMDYIESQFLTSEQIIDILIDKVKDSRYLRGANIWMDGFYGFSPQQYELITELLRYANNVTITLPLEKAPDFLEKLNENNPFYESQNAYQKLYVSALENAIKINEAIVLERPDIARENKELYHLEKEYLKYHPKSYNDQAKNILINEFSNQYEEVTSLAKGIIGLVRDEGYRYKDIAVIAGNISEYGGIVKSIFAEYNIPCFIDEKRNISTHALVELIKGILDVVNNNWSYNSICRVLKTGLFPISQEEIDLLENYLLAYGIRGKNMWIEAWEFYNLKGLSQEKQAYLVEKEKHINQIREKVISYLLVLHNKLKVKSKKDRPNVKEISIAIYEFLEEIRAEEQIEKWQEIAKENQDLSLEKEHSQIWDRVKEIFETMVDILGDQVIITRLYTQILDSAFTAEQMGMIPPSKDQVIIGDIERSRINSVKALFVIGTNDGMIPKNDDGPEIFSDVDRMKIEETDVELLSASRKQAFESQFLVYLAINKARERLIVSCSLADELGKSMRPSIVMHRLRRIFPKTKIYSEDDFLDNIYNPVSTFGYIGRKMKEEIDGRKTGEDWKDAVSWYMEEDKWKDRVSKAVDHLFYTNQQHYLSEETAKMLYDNPLHSSVSKLETFRQCAFCYFIKYGIKAEERKLFEFNAMDLGILFHKALEEYPLRLEKDNLTWRDIDEKQVPLYVDQVVEDVVVRYGGSMGRPSAKNKYKIGQIKNMTSRAVSVLTSQIKKGDFDPKEYEVAFGDGEFPPIVINIDSKRKMLLTGTIDRVDVYSSEDGEFIKILDYKSGSKKFNLTEVYYGLQLQLLLYLDAYLELNKGKLPAGVFYFYINNPIIKYEDGKSDKGVEKVRANSFKLSGLSLEDTEIVRAMEREVKGEIIPVKIKNDGDFYAGAPVASNDEFDLLREHIVDIIRDLGKDIINGKVSAKPYQFGDKNPCEYCKYLSICQFDDSQDDNEYEQLGQLDQKLVWEKLKAKKGGQANGGSVDTGAKGSN